MGRLVERVWCWVCGVAGALVLVSGAHAAGPLPDLGVLGGGMRTEGFAQVLQPREFSFPQDHGPHPDHRQEWWYVTGNLDAADGERLGFELTFFRFALAPGDDPTGARADGETAVARVDTVARPNAGAAAEPASRWRSRQIYMAHFAITDVSRGQFRFSQKLSRGAAGLAGAELPPLHVWVDDWGLGGDAAGGAGTAGRLRASAAASDATSWDLHAVEAGYELTLDARALMQPVLNGDRGLSRKSDEPGSASYYYSIPRVAVHGRLIRDGKPLEVHGLAWVDREWGSGTLSASEQGWDWFALQLNDGSCLMFYALRRREGGWDHNSAGTWVSATGESRPLSKDEVQIAVTDYWTNPRGERYPAGWRVRIPTTGLDVTVHPVLANQELTASTRYWEGAVDVTGTSGGQRTEGRGYVELVGYAAQ